MRDRIQRHPASRMLAALLTGAALLAAPAAHADTQYKIQPLVKAGDTIGGLRLNGTFSPSALNDRGQLAFLAAATPGGRALFSFSDGQIAPLVISEGEGPDGLWPRGIDINPSLKLNQQGDVAFTLNGRGIYLWSAATKKFTPIATVGMPALDGLTFNNGTLNSPALNNRADVAVGMTVKDAEGKSQIGLFLRSAEGKLLRVALNGQSLPDGSTISRTSAPVTLNDAGAVGFFAARAGITGWGVYLWEQGTITPVAVTGASLPNGTTIAHPSTLRVNNRNREVPVALHQSDSPSVAGLYRFSNGQFSALLLPGQDLPGGGKLRSVREIATSDTGLSANRHISSANELGQFAFIASLEGGGVGAYLLDVDGKVSLILKPGMTTDLGPITAINPVGDQAGVGLNSRGQVALSVKFDGGPETLVLLTPAAP